MKPKQIAAVVTEYFAGSHADVIVSKFLKGFPTDEGLMKPRVELCSLYIDQVADKDIGIGVAAEAGVPVYPSIVQALTRGEQSLAVDGVLLIGEHGDYAWNEMQQQLFPRKYFMEQIAGVLATSQQSVPVFNDKHLSYNWHDARWMVDRARKVGAPFMAGSSLPVAWRNPWLEHERETNIQEAVAVGFSGLDIYGFHTLEVLQCMVERRVGGETGVAAVTCLEGAAVWRAADQGLWSRELAEAACAAIVNKPSGSMQDHCPEPAVFLIEYRDGLRAAVLMLTDYVEDLAYAARVDGQTVATEFYAQGHGGEQGPFAHFAYLALNVEDMFVSGTPAYPVERTLLTTGVLEAALKSRHAGQTRLETPWLDVVYQSYDALRWRPTQSRPAGACLDPWPPAH
ncbi:MAG: hypothetical protein ABGZ17_26075 [Planctomycetaceae bacterium]